MALKADEDFFDSLVELIEEKVDGLPERTQRESSSAYVRRVFEDLSDLIKPERRRLMPLEIDIFQLTKIAQLDIAQAWGLDPEDISLLAGRGRVDRAKMLAGWCQEDPEARHSVLLGRMLSSAKTATTYRFDGTITREELFAAVKMYDSVDLEITPEVVSVTHKPMPTHAVEAEDGSTAIVYQLVQRGQTKLSPEGRPIDIAHQRSVALVINHEKGRIDLRGASGDVEKVKKRFDAIMGAVGKKLQLSQICLGSKDIWKFIDMAGGHVRKGKLVNPEGSEQGDGAVEITVADGYTGGDLRTVKRFQDLPQDWDLARCFVFIPFKGEIFSLHLNITNGGLRFPDSLTRPDLIEHVIGLVEKFQSERGQENEGRSSGS